MCHVFWLLCLLMFLKIFLSISVIMMMMMMAAICSRPSTVIHILSLVIPFDLSKHVFFWEHTELIIYFFVLIYSSQMAWFAFWFKSCAHLVFGCCFVFLLAHWNSSPKHGSYCCFHLNYNQGKQAKVVGLHWTFFVCLFRVLATRLQ